VDDSLRDDKPLESLQVHRPSLKINDETTLKHKKEFIILLVLMPVILALTSIGTSTRLRPGNLTSR
jgi:hypothetical protein